VQRLCVDYVDICQNYIFIVSFFVYRTQIELSTKNGKQSFLKTLSPQHCMSQNIAVKIHTLYHVGVSRGAITKNPFRLKLRNDRRTKISTANLSSGLNGVCQETFQGGPPSVFLWHQNPI
jgi:hypothetical protein